MYEQGFTVIISEKKMQFLHEKVLLTPMKDVIFLSEITKSGGDLPGMGPATWVFICAVAAW